MSMSEESKGALRVCARIMARERGPASAAYISVSTDACIQKGVWPTTFELRDIPSMFYPNAPAKAESLRRDMEEAVKQGWLPKGGFLTATDLTTWIECPDIPDNSPLRFWLVGLSAEKSTEKSLPNMPWQSHAREIGINLRRKYPSLSVLKLAEKVRQEMLRRHPEGEVGLSGARKKVVSVETIKRHALKGV